MTNVVDRVIDFISPTWGNNRLAARISRDFAMSYRGGIESRLDRPVPASVNSGSLRYQPLGGATLVKLRDRARHLDRNNVLASSLLDRATENVVGGGLKLKAMSADTTWNASAERRFEKWVDEADVRGMSSFYDLQALLYRTLLREGDVGVILIDDNGFPRLQAIEGDLIETPPGKSSIAIDGVEYNDVGKPIRFNVRQQKATIGAPLEWKTVGARDFVYLLRQTRTSQTRGEPIFASTFWLFDQVDGYCEAVVTAARAGACQVMLVKKNGASQQLANIQQTTKDARGNDRKAIKLEPLSVHYLNPGEEMQGFNPTQPTQSFGELITILCRLMGLNLGLTLEQVMLDFSKTNYSSSRAARLQADATACVERDRFTRRFLKRIYPWWVEKMIAAGELPEGPADRWNCDWVAEPRPWVDPEKEIKAALMELDMGLTTLDLLAKERGREFSKLIEHRAGEIETMTKLKVPVVMSNQTRDPGAKPAAAAAPGETPGTPPPPGAKGDPADAPAAADTNDGDEGSDE